MELFNLVIIVPVREVLLVEILLKLFPPTLPFYDLLHFLEVLPLNGCYYYQIEDGYPRFHIARVLLDSGIFSHP